MLHRDMSFGQALAFKIVMDEDESDKTYAQFSLQG